MKNEITLYSFENIIKKMGIETKILGVLTLQDSDNFSKINDKDIKFVEGKFDIEFGWKIGAHGEYLEFNKSKSGGLVNHLKSLLYICNKYKIYPQGSFSYEMITSGMIEHGVGLVDGLRDIVYYSMDVESEKPKKRKVKFEK